VTAVDGPDAPQGPEPSEGEPPAPTRFAHDLDGVDPAEPFTRRSATYTTRRVLRRARRLVGDDPRLLPIVLWGTPGSAKRAITSETRAVIEGFPRSGNTFAYFALQEANGPIPVASHVHVPAQVVQAVRTGTPTLFVVREPVACLASLLTAAPHVRFRPAYEEYIHHHRKVVPLADDLVVGTFEQITTDYGVVIDALNDRFGTSFARFVQTPENVDRVFARIDAHYEELYGDRASERVVPRPSPARKAEKRWLTDQLTAPGLADLHARATEVYEELASRAAT
jgi:hypothetical protein